MLPIVRSALFAVGLALPCACTPPPAPAPPLSPPLASAEVADAGSTAGSMWDELLAEYRAHELPMPPADAVLVRFRAGSDQDGPIYHLAFARLDGGKPLLPLLVGTKWLSPPGGEPVEPAAAEPAAAEHVLTEDFGDPFPLNLGLATAVQCKARGWDGLADALLKPSLERGAGGFAGTFLQRPNAPPLEALAAMAAAHWGNQLAAPESDRAAILTRLEKLVASGRLRDPTLGADVPDGERRVQFLLASLRKSLVPHPEHAGVEAMIDGLADATMTRALMGGSSEDPRYLALADLGFEAVPALIGHLGDDRLTRSIRQGFNNFPTYLLTVQDLASDLLQELSGDELGKDWLRRQQGYEVARKDAQTWWDAARATGEEAYLVAHAIPAAADAKWPNQRMLRLLSKRYPARLPDVYARILKHRPELVSDPATEAIAGSSLPDARKVALFAAAAADPWLDHRRAALRALLPLDAKKFSALLIKTLDGLPVTPKDAYWKCPEGSFANLAMETADPAVWRGLVRAAKRADVGLRMQLLNPMNYSYIGERQRAQRLQFLLQWLGDDTVREAKREDPQWQGPVAAFTIAKITVRDFAALQLASILGLPRHDATAWSAAQRAEVRAAAESALQKLGSKPF
jgi:hypothetical protein